MELMSKMAADPKSRQASNFNVRTLTGKNFYGSLDLTVAFWAKPITPITRQLQICTFSCFFRTPSSPL